MLIGFIFIGIIYNSKIASKKGGYAKIASWNFKSNMNQSVNQKISLSSTITKTISEISDGYIAPGTEGSFFIVIDAKGSRVKIEYNIKLINEINTPKNLYFMIRRYSRKISYFNRVIQ